MLLDSRSEKATWALSAATINESRSIRDVWRPLSWRAPSVAMMEPVDPRTSDDHPNVPRFDRASDGRVAVQAHLRATFVVVAGVLPHHRHREEVDSDRAGEKRAK